MNQVATLQPIPQQQVTLSLVSIGVREIKARVQAIQECMDAVMKPDVHYGIIPGAKKPSLWKPGAEAICAMFSLSPSLVSTVTADDAERTIRWMGTQYVDSPAGPRSLKRDVEGETRGIYEIVSVCALIGPGGVVLASCSGSANNVENKYRTLSVWDCRNTVRKMAEKRALVAAVLLATGASDMFSQDLEDLPEGAMQESRPSRPAPGSSPSSGTGAASTNGLSDKQNGLAFVKVKGIIPASDINGFMDWFKTLQKGSKIALDDLIAGGDKAENVVKIWRERTAAAAAPASTPAPTPAPSADTL